MAMPPQLAAALAKRTGNSSKSTSSASQRLSNQFENSFFASKGVKNPDPKEKGGLPGGLLKGKPAVKKKKKVTPAQKKALQAAAARKMGMGG